MTGIAKALVVIVLFPLALCIGMYACTATHVAVISHALAPTQPARPVQSAQLPAQLPRLRMIEVAPGLWCCDLSAGGSGIVDAYGHTYQRTPAGWVQELRAAPALMQQAPVATDSDWTKGLWWGVQNRSDAGACNSPPSDIINRNDWSLGCQSGQRGR
jgi:hypothetical protein